MILLDSKTGERFRGVVEEASPDELRKLEGNEQFVFNWSKEIAHQVFKIRRENKKEILGLISLIDINRELRIHINLIESAKEHKGKDKRIENIPGCLISYACKMAFEKGYDGFVSLEPKTQLIDHYHKMYGFVRVGTQMAVFLEASKLLISKYIDDEEI